jgi:ATP-binding cassette subfamily C (CFTR/MRP) protein 1
MLGDMLYLDEDTIEEHKDAIMDAELRKILNKACFQNKSKVKLGGSISYVQQVPWIQNKTIRDNILFGLPLDEDKYNKTIEICQLASDLQILPGGDLTEIGEKGINLSGGQKARVSLARAVYADKDIVLMDDPVSALDANVKKRVFEEVFMQELKYKTRILVTHAVDFLDQVDRIVIMESGRIKYIGTYEELQHSDEIKHIIETLAHKNEEPQEDSKDNEPSKLIEPEVEEKKERSCSYISQEGTNINDEENDETIEVGWDIYAKFFFSNGSWVIYLITVCLFFAYSYFIVYSTIYFGYWIQNSDEKDAFWEYFWLVLLYPLGYSIIITVIFVIVTTDVVRGAKILHQKMLAYTCNAPINLYFDKTPSGRILNRFSKDINKVDDNIAQ